MNIASDTRNKHTVVRSVPRLDSPAFDFTLLRQDGTPSGVVLRLKSGPGVVNQTTKPAWDTTLLDGLQAQPEENYLAIVVKVRTALERLKTGAAEAKDFDRVGAAFNVALVRAESIDFRAVEVMRAGIDAIEECDSIHQRHRKYGFTGTGLQAVNDAMNLYEDILRLSPPVLMELAVEESARRMLKQSRRTG